MSDSNLPAEFWSALLRIEGVTSRTDATVTGLKTDMATLITKQEKQDAAITDLTKRVGTIEAERGRDLPIFDKMKIRLDDLETWQATSTTSATTAFKIAGWVWGVAGTGVIGAVVFVVKQYLTS